MQSKTELFALQRKYQDACIPLIEALWVAHQTRLTLGEITAAINADRTPFSLSARIALHENELYKQGKDPFCDASLRYNPLPAVRQSMAAALLDTLDVLQTSDHTELLEVARARDIFEAHTPAVLEAYTSYAGSARSGMDVFRGGIQVAMRHAIYVAWSRNLEDARCARQQGLALHASITVGKIPRLENRVGIIAHREELLSESREYVPRDAASLYREPGRSQYFRALGLGQSNGCPVLRSRIDGFSLMPAFAAYVCESFEKAVLNDLPAKAKHLHPDFFAGGNARIRAFDPDAQMVTR